MFKLYDKDKNVKNTVVVLQKLAGYAVSPESGVYGNVAIIFSLHFQF